MSSLTWVDCVINYSLYAHIMIYTSQGFRLLGIWCSYQWNMPVAIYFEIGLKKIIARTFHFISNISNTRLTMLMRFLDKRVNRWNIQCRRFQWWHPLPKYTDFEITISWKDSSRLKSELLIKVQQTWSHAAIYTRLKGRYGAATLVRHKKGHNLWITPHVLIWGIRSKTRISI